MTRWLQAAKSPTNAGTKPTELTEPQPEAFSEKTGKRDIRGAYGLHGREMIAWLTHLQHTRGKHVCFVGWDHPPTSCVVLLRPSSYKSTMIQ